MAGDLVLVTGGSGFVGAHCIVALLRAGYRVRTTVRSPARVADVLAMVSTAGLGPGVAVDFAEANLTLDAGWPKAVEGCDYVLHVASPFPATAPAHENEILIPARDGALRVLRAARDAGVKRVILTSSFAAIGYGHPDTATPFTEEDWTDLDNVSSAYVKSKTVAERAAWAFARDEDGAPELAVINPVGIFGPVLGSDFSSSIEIIQQMLTGAMPRLPRLSFGVVDVRDVADLHVRAMTNPAAAGQRFLATAGVMSLMEIAVLLRARLGDDASAVSTRAIPDWVVRLARRTSPRVAEVASDIGVVRNATAQKAERLLGWSPRPREDTIVDTAASLVALAMRSPVNPRGSAR